MFVHDSYWFRKQFMIETLGIYLWWVLDKKGTFLPGVQLNRTYIYDPNTVASGLVILVHVVIGHILSHLLPNGIMHITFIIYISIESLFSFIRLMVFQHVSKYCLLQLISSYVIHFHSPLSCELNSLQCIKLFVYVPWFIVLINMKKLIGKIVCLPRRHQERPLTALMENIKATLLWRSCAAYVFQAKMKGLRKLWRCCLANNATRSTIEVVWKHCLNIEVLIHYSMQH